MLYRDNQNIPQKITVDYRTILERFWKTLNLHAQQHPEIAALKLTVQQLHFNLILSDAHLNHLQKICRLLNQEKQQHAIILKLHQEFCDDLETFKRGARINTTNEVYFLN